MSAELNADALYRVATNDAELQYKFRGFSGTVRLLIDDAGVDVTIDNGRVTEVTPSGSEPATVTLRGKQDDWAKAFTPGKPIHGYQSLTNSASWITTEGDYHAVIAPYQAGLQRLFLVAKESVVGPTPRREPARGFEATDTAVGRYTYVHANDLVARMYYETAGTGPVPLLLQATAGADSRQYRHMLADPRLQERFTMYAYDLPYHGRSLPPEGVRWWEQAYLPDRDQLMNWIVGLADTLELEQPFFLGTSVGGQLALDLAAEHGDRFGGFIAVNGWYDVPAFAQSFDNDPFRTPSVSPELFPALNFGATSPTAPEAHAHEVYWIYRSNFAGVYAGDNDYFMRGHDLKVNGHKIDAHAKPVFAVTGEYDSASRDQEHGSPAVERLIPGAKFFNGENLGHFGPTDDPVGFNDFLIPILDEALSWAGTAEARHD